jgi:hypothetical protein
VARQAGSRRGDDADDAEIISRRQRLVAAFTSSHAISLLQPRQLAASIADHPNGKMSEKEPPIHVTPAYRR